MPRSGGCMSFGKAVPFLSNLEELTFGRSYTEDLSRMTFASTLRSLKFGDGFNQNLLKLQLPSSLESLSLGDAWLFKAACWISGDASGCGAGREGYKQEWSKAAWPSGLRNLTVEQNFVTKGGVKVTFPEGLESLSFGGAFNQSFENVKLPEKLISLSFGRDFNKPLQSLSALPSLQRLVFGRDFNQMLGGCSGWWEGGQSRPEQPGRAGE
eukprot:g13934.t1